MSRSYLSLGLLASFAWLAGCGSSSSSALFGHGSGGAFSGTGATSSAGAGGTTSSGGSVMATDGGSGGFVSESGGASSLDSGAGGTVGADSGAGGFGLGGSAGSEGSGGAPGGAWARCMTDADCKDGRVCTEAAQSVVVSGRPGGCVHRCTFGTSTCDPPPSAGTVTCTSLLVTSFCTITCPNSGPCPAGMDCVLGSCFYSK